MEFGALVAFGRQGHRQSSGVGEQNELSYSQQGEALVILQTEVPFDPGEMAFNVSTRIDDQSLPLLEERKGCQFAFANPTQVVVDSRMGMQEIMDHFEHEPIEVG